MPDDTTGEARMYAQDSEMCPVRCFKQYINKLHPDCNDLWQRPRDSFLSSDNTWYCKTPLWKNTLCQIISNISQIASLSKRYTNHCIRATSICALDRAGFEARQIIRATGHKSELSIKRYSRRLTEGTKQKMSDALSTVLMGPSEPSSSKHQDSVSVIDDITEKELTKYIQPKMTIISLSYLCQQPACHQHCLLQRHLQYL